MEKHIYLYKIYDLYHNYIIYVQNKLHLYILNSTNKLQNLTLIITNISRLLFNTSNYSYVSKVISKCNCKSDYKNNIKLLLYLIHT